MIQVTIVSAAVPTMNLLKKHGPRDGVKMGKTIAKRSWQVMY